MKRLPLPVCLFLLCSLPALLPGAEEMSFFQSNQLALTENQIYTFLNLHPIIFYNRTDADQTNDDLRKINDSERLFGPVQKIFLPPEDACQRIEAKIDMSYGVTAEYQNEGLEFELRWEIYADSCLIARGKILPAKRNYSFFIPEDIRDTKVGHWVVRGDGQLYIEELRNGFLRPAPENCPGYNDRLGDDGKESAGARHRDISYLIAVKAVAYQLICLNIEDGGGGEEIWQPVGESQTDWFYFTVAITEKRRDEQPIKIFIRE
ncbi:MAG: hypothetical protein WC668_00900 [Patescibacteria group bacterium]|jgi:hypothetical protein